jgi:hypothetical protein
MSTTTVNAAGVEFDIELGGKERHSRLARTRHWYMTKAEEVESESLGADGNAVWGSKSRPESVTCRDRQPGMIAAMALRLLYLIFSRLHDSLTLLSRASASRTSNCSSYATRSPYSAAPAPSLAWTGPTARCSPHSSNACPRRCAGTASSPRPGSCAGTAAW